MKNIQILSNDEVSDLISVEECIPIMEELFNNLDKCQMPPKTYLTVPNGDFRSMPAIYDDIAGIKWCGVHLDELKRKCSILAKILINDVKTGRLLIMMDAEILTAVRTAAVTGLATKYLSAPDSSTAAFIGCGSQTLYQIQAVCSVRDIKQIRLYDLSKVLQKKLKLKFGYFVNGTIKTNCEVVLCDSVKECVKPADIVTTLTPSREGFLKHKWLKNYVHVNAIGADAEGKRELCKSVIDNMDFVVYDDWEQCSHSGEIQYFDRIRTHSKTLGEVALWYSKITRHNELYPDRRQMTIRNPIDAVRSFRQTLFDSTGLAIEDIATAKYIYGKINENQRTSTI